jgi:hypothetical protein
MTIRITEIESRLEDAGSNDVSDDQVDTLGAVPKVFKVEGTLLLKDAELLESICYEVSDQTGRPLVIELSDICFLDHASAAVLCRMKRQRGIKIKGMNLFIKKVMELTNDADSEESPHEANGSHT